MAENAAEPFGLAGDIGSVFYADHCDVGETGEKRESSPGKRVSQILGEFVDELVGVHCDLASAAGADTGDEPGDADRVQEQCVEADADDAAIVDDDLFCEAGGDCRDDGAVFCAVRYWSVFVGRRAGIADEGCAVSTGNDTLFVLPQAGDAVFRGLFADTGAGVSGELAGEQFSGSGGRRHRTVDYVAIGAELEVWLLVPVCVSRAVLL